MHIPTYQHAEYMALLYSCPGYLRQPDKLQLNDVANYIILYFSIANYKRIRETLTTQNKMHFPSLQKAYTT